MIEFNGTVTGKAKKRLIQQARFDSLRFLLFVLIFTVPVTIMQFVKNSWITFGVILCGISILMLIAIMLPTLQKADKYKYRICIEDGVIILYNPPSISERKISYVKRLIDYGEYYELKFYFGKSMSGYIFQKNLLVKGTLEEFEALFEGKIERI